MWKLKILFYKMMRNSVEISLYSGDISAEDAIYEYNYWTKKNNSTKPLQE